MKYFFSVLFLFTSLFSFSQKVSVSGFLQDAENAERLISATVYDSKSGEGILSNNAGFYSLSFPKGSEIFLEYAYFGYENYKLHFIIEKDTVLNIKLNKSIIKTDTVVISAKNTAVKQTQMSILEIKAEQIQKLPALLGEPDALKVFQLMPGVQAGGEGTSGIYVRGGSPDQNLILLDDVPLYYVNHLGNIVSIFDVNSIQNIKLLKGAFPARYGGRLSSVVDIQLKEGNKQKSSGNFGLGLISSNVSLNFPIKKNVSSLNISGRISTIGLISTLATAIYYKGKTVGAYNFYDLSAKYHHILSPKDRISISAYIGQDDFFLHYIPKKSDKDTSKLKQISNMGWGWQNQLLSAKWNHIFGDKLFQNLTLGYTKFKYYLYANNTTKTETDVLKAQEKYGFYSGIRDVMLKSDWDFYPTSRHQIKFGFATSNHLFSPSITSYSESANNQPIGDTTLGKKGIISSFESNLYAEDEIRINEKMSANVGLHFSHYLVRKKNYFSLQPRLNFRYSPRENWAFKASFTQMQQYLHLLSTSSLGLANDLWVPPTDKIPPQKATQIALGTTYLLPKGIEVSAEIFYKKMTHLITYKEGISLLYTDKTWDEQVETNGIGNVYGVECMAKKTIGKTTGWIGYTLSYNYRKFENVNNGKAFPYTYDRRHNFSIVVNHELNKHVSLSADWTINSGRAVSLAQVAYSIGEVSFYNPPYTPFATVQHYGEKNSYRMPVYHRLDITAQFHKQKKKGERTWIVGVYNAYNKLNPLFYYYLGTNTSQQSTPNAGKLYGLTLFPILPSVSYSYKF